MMDVQVDQAAAERIRQAQAMLSEALAHRVKATQAGAVTQVQTHLAVAVEQAASV